MSALRVSTDERRPFFTVKTLAAYLAISERTVYTLLDETIPSHRAGGRRRIWADSVDAYLASVREVFEPRERRPSSRADYGAWEQSEREYARVLIADPCCYCGAEAKHIDHIVPNATGGKHAWENLTAACAFCNMSKSARPLLAFLLRRVSA